MIIRESEYGDRNPRVGLWAWNVDGRESWSHDDFPTKEAAAKEAAAEEPGLAAANRLVVGQVAEVSVFAPCALRVIEQMCEDVFDEVGEVAEDWLAHVPNEARKQLGKALADVVGKWLTDHHLWPTFWAVEDIQPVDAILADAKEPS